MLKSALRRFWALALIIAIASFAAVAAYAWRLSPTYTASSVVSVGPRGDTTGSAALFTLMATKYVAFAAGDSLAAGLAEEYGVSRDVVEGGLEVRLQERTTNINIAMTSSSSQLSRQIAGSVSTMVANRAGGDPMLQAQIVVPASGNSVVTRTGRTRVLGIGLLGSCGFAALAAVALDQIVQPRGRRRIPLKRATPLD